jgi:hypothetical protein
MSDDLDSLLDDALNDLDVQEEKHKKEREEKAAQLLLEQEAAAAQAAAPAAGEELALMESLKALLGSLGNMDPTGELSEDQMAAVQRTLAEAVTNLKKDASPEEQAELAKCDGILNRLSSKEGEGQPPPSEAEVENMLETLKGLQEAVKTHEAVSGGAVPPEATAAAPGAEPSPAVAEEQKQLEDALQKILDPAALSASFKVIREGYPDWLRKNGPTLPEAERKRYEEQQVRINELCEFLESQTSVHDSDGVDKFVAMVEQLQALGAPPAELTGGAVRPL